MVKEPTKADLARQIAEMEAAHRETPQDALVRALAGLIASHETAGRIKHAFYRSDDTGTQLALDMHNAG